METSVDESVRFTRLLTAIDDSVRFICKQMY